MAQETKQTQVPMLCATGCGFYGNARTNGMCSVCYKDSLQRQNNSGTLTPPVVEVGSSEDCLPAQHSESGDPHSAPPFPTTDTPSEQNSVVSSLTLSSQASLTCLEECEPAVDKGHRTEELKAVATVYPDPDPDQGSAEARDGTLENLKQNRSRCFMCRKKVGLTGFDCRCGNVFCGTHRYSDVHSCTFDYKADAAEKIRKENPVIVGEKIQKI
ncbi:AN1-type zinc finger protein 6 [Paramormyrops kingsleyae]|nr:AN1-type zinc finger protein 6-like [Paramormyrops kingsleyae]XP_023669793.1 AN1-type zinc finger protein 6-like [Paramormyrops kingsleyae]XP_023669794.1 AN1-type zinc finger protein 6-like [Paramormyrops kingsleyae]XP_023669795.1 AN1-type zinc finger protein 6-like [Paramormyrops kingsleyae]